MADNRLAGSLRKFLAETIFKLGGTIDTIAVGGGAVVGRVAASFLNANGLIVIGPENSTGIVAVGGANAMGAAAMAGGRNRMSRNWRHK